MKTKKKVKPLGSWKMGIAKKKDNFKIAGDQLEKHWHFMRKIDDWEEVWKFIKFIVEIVDRDKPPTKKELAQLEMVKELGDLK